MQKDYTAITMSTAAHVLTQSNHPFERLQAKQVAEFVAVPQSYVCGLVWFHKLAVMMSPGARQVNHSDNSWKHLVEYNAVLQDELAPARGRVTVPYTPGLGFVRRERSLIQVRCTFRMASNVTLFDSLLETPSSRDRYVYAYKH